MLINYEKYCDDNFTLMDAGAKRDNIDNEIIDTLFELIQRGREITISTKVYNEGVALIYVNGEYYNAYDWAEHKMFSGAVGDYTDTFII